MEHDFHYISKHDPKVQHAFHDLLAITHQVQNEVRDKFTFEYRPVGSYSRNMITYDAKSNVGFDFDIDLVLNPCAEDYSPKEINDILRNALNKVITGYRYSPPEDSTRVLTIKLIDHHKSRIIHSCDFAITQTRTYWGSRSKREYIHFDKRFNDYSWRDLPQTETLIHQIRFLKDRGLWPELRKLYLDKKNHNSSPHIHSRQLFEDAVRELHWSNGGMLLDNFLFL